MMPFCIFYNIETAQTIISFILCCVVFFSQYVLKLPLHIRQYVPMDAVDAV